MQWSVSLWDNWLFIAFVAPILWALVNLLDVYFIQRVYEYHLDAFIISGIFQFMPWLLVLFGLVRFQWPEQGMTVIFALSGGGLFLISYFFYFKALSIIADATLLEILQNLSVPIVPFLAFFLLGEHLLPINYLGIVLVFLGTMFFLWDKKIDTKGFLRVFQVMLWAVFFLALSMIAEGKAYESSGSDFWSIYLLFSAGSAFIAFLSLIWTGNVRIIDLVSKYFPSFFFMEFLSVVATIASQRAISISPFVSFVAVIESIMPIFVILFSGLIWITFAFIPLNGGRELLYNMFSKQLSNFGVKLAALFVTIIGIYLVS